MQLFAFKNKVCIYKILLRVYRTKLYNIFVFIVNKIILNFRWCNPNRNRAFLVHVFPFHLLGKLLKTFLTAKYWRIIPTTTPKYPYFLWYNFSFNRNRESVYYVYFFGHSKIINKINEKYIIVFRPTIHYRQLQIEL